MQTPAYALLGILILAALSRKWSLPFLPSFQILLGSTLLALAVINPHYMHPLVSMMARRSGLVAMRGMGISSGLDLDLDVAGTPA